MTSKKATRIVDIFTKRLKADINIYLKDITALINDCLEKDVFPDDCVSYFREKRKSKSGSYRNVSIVSHISRVFERILYTRIGDFISSTFFSFLCGFREK